MKDYKFEKKHIALICGPVLLVAVLIGLSLYFRPVTENKDANNIGVSIIDNSPVLLDKIEEETVPTTAEPAKTEDSNTTVSNEETSSNTTESDESTEATEPTEEAPHYAQLPEGKKLTVNNDGTPALVDANNKTTDSSSSNNSSSSSSSDSANQELAPKYVTLNISCHGILDRATDSLKEAIPNDGYLLTSCQVEIKDGDTVYDVLMRVVNSKGIPCTHAESVYGQYVSMIDNLSDSKIGHTAGWCYYVNNVMPQVSCDNTLVQEGNVISWEYDDDWALLWE